MSSETAITVSMIFLLALGTLISAASVAYLYHLVGLLDTVVLMAGWNGGFALMKLSSLMIPEEYR